MSFLWIRNIGVEISLPKILGGEIIGYRLWKIGHKKLLSAAVHVEWEKNMERAACCHPGMANLILGYHAFKTKELLIDHYLPYMMSYDSQIIIGTVWMWGEVVEHRLGYRSEYVAIRSLDEYYNGVKKVNWGLQKYMLMKRLQKYYDVETSPSLLFPPECNSIE
ncbi:MAG TPA: hypothetical protein VEP90_25255 [Methylomirabilota bacterium]|nr:hypothetical protein [Methylomirabilota bacterium]